MLYLKGCPKCKGDLNEESDNYGRYLLCLQCGFTRDLVPQGAEAGWLSWTGRGKQVAGG